MIEADPCALRIPSARCRPRPGTPAPIRRAVAIRGNGGRRWRPGATAQAIDIRRSTIIHSFRMTFFPSLEALAVGPAAHRLAAAASAGRRRRRHARRRRPLLCEIAFAAANTSSTTAGPTPMSAPAAAIIRSCRSRCRSRPRPAAGCWCAPAPQADAVRGGAGRRADRRLPALRRLSVARHLPDRAGMASCSASRGFLKRTDQQFHWENAGYDTLRRFPRRARLAQAQDHPPRARGRAGRRHHRALADRRRPHRKRVGRVLRLLHGDRLAQMGPALSHPRRSFR